MGECTYLSMAVWKIRLESSGVDPWHLTRLLNPRYQPDCVFRCNYMLKHNPKCTYPSQRPRALRKQNHRGCRCLPSGRLVGSFSCSIPSSENWYSEGHYPSPPSPSLPISATFTPNQQTRCILANGPNSLFSWGWHLMWHSCSSFSEKGYGKYCPLTHFLSVSVKWNIRTFFPFFCKPLF